MKTQATGQVPGYVKTIELPSTTKQSIRLFVPQGISLVKQEQPGTALLFKVNGLVLAETNPDNINLSIELNFVGARSVERVLDHQRALVLLSLVAGKHPLEEFGPAGPNIINPWTNAEELTLTIRITYDNDRQLYIIKAQGSYWGHPLPGRPAVEGKGHLHFSELFYPIASLTNAEFKTLLKTSL